MFTDGQAIMRKLRKRSRPRLGWARAIPELRRNLALAYMRQGNLEAAIAELRTASRDAPEDTAIWYTLGNAYLQSRNWSRAVAAFETRLSLRSDWPEATFNLALASERSGDTEETVAAYRRFLAGAGANDPRRRAEAQRRVAELERKQSR